MSTRSLAARLFLVCLLARIAAVVLAHLDPVQATRLDAPDTLRAYRPMAANLVSGAGYMLASDAGAPLLIPPVYPAWLAGLMFVTGWPAGSSLPSLVIGLAAAVWRALSVVLLWGLARSRVQPREAWAAALLLLLDPWEWFWTPYVLKESVAVPVLLVAIRAFLWARDSSQPRRAVVAGLAATAATVAWFGAGLVAVWALRVVWRDASPATRDRDLRFAASYLAGAALPAALWLGFALNVVPPAALELHRIPLKLAARGFEPEPSRRGHPPDRAISAISLQEASGPPRPVDSRTLLARLPWNLALHAVNLLRPVYEGARFATFLVLGVPYLLLLALAALGFRAARRERREHTELSSLLGLLIGFLVLVGGGVRQRQYLTPLLAVYGGVGLCALAPGSRRPPSPAPTGTETGVSG